MKTKSRHIREPAGSFFLFGPRGTGKTTWLEHRLADALVIDFLQPDVYRRYKTHPEYLRDFLKANSSANTVIIDEVQRVPEILTVVHSLIEQRAARFVLTGSSARKLRRGGTDLLAGRALLSSAHPFMASELGNDFALEDALRHGTIPLILDAEDRHQALEAYVALYMREEISAEGLVRNIGDFARFLEAMSLSHGSLLNTSAIARECEVSRKTVESYISILEDILLGVRLPVFSRKAKRHLIKASKFYFFDAGVFRAIRPVGPLDRPEELNGATLEGLVFQHLRAWADYSGYDRSLFYWRTKSGLEVDFVIYGRDVFMALEVKNSAKVHRRDIRGLKTFQEDYPQSKAILLYRGSDRLLLDNVLCLPCDTFLKQLTPHQGPCPTS